VVCGSSPTRYQIISNESEIGRGDNRGEGEREVRIEPITETNNYLIVGGGGGSADPVSAASGGGGGGGGVLRGILDLIAGQTYQIIIGSSDQPSSAFGLTAHAGGRGAGNYGAATIGASGGGGGGWAISYGTPHPVGAEGISGQGHRGGDAYGTDGDGNQPHTAGGGGGAGGPGGTGTIEKAGDGGNGIVSAISGTSTYYGGGGGGGAFGYNPYPVIPFNGVGGLGGGGQGGRDTTNIGATAGLPNTGGGGGSAKFGGSGVVIISIFTDEYSGITTGAPEITVIGEKTIITFRESGSYTA
jgi:hypothetical protein